MFEVGENWDNVKFRDLSCAQHIAFLAENLEPKEMHRAAVSEGKYAEKDSADYSVYTYNTQACGNDHDEREIQQAVEERKIQMKILLDRSRQKLLVLKPRWRNKQNWWKKAKAK